MSSQHSGNKGQQNNDTLIDEPPQQTSKPARLQPGVGYRDADKVAIIPVQNIDCNPKPAKPDWMKIKLPADPSRIAHIKAALRKNNLHSVCEEAACPNLAECFHHGTATFMILGAICTRRCPFC
ncbi:MAG: hypothetical protein ACRC9T_08925, partial [Vibrionaceae bacterium]